MHQNKKAAPLGGPLDAPAPILLDTAMPLPEAALAYAASGWPVLPVWEYGAKSKQPRTRNGHRGATTNVKVVRQWWDRWPTANIGYAPPVGMIVLDLDRPDALADLEAINGGPLPETLTARSGRAGGGWHLYYRTQATELSQGGLRYRDGRSVPGVDVRLGGRGYVIVPPSVHPISGTMYRWEHLRDPVALPAALERACGPVAPRPMPLHRNGLPRAERSLEGLLRTVRTAAEGTRNRSLFWAACRMAEHEQAGRPTNWAGLTEAASAAGLPHAEILATIRSAIDTTVLGVSA